MSLKASHLLKLSLLMISSVWLSAADATVLYKKVDKDGKVTYTDKPSDDAVMITVQTDQNQQQSESNRDEISDSKSYEVFSIDSPSNSEKVYSHDGSVNIVIGITPQVQPSHSIRLHMDGVQVGQDQKIPYFNLRDVDNGTYELLAIVIDDETQQIVQTSKAVTFHLLPTSN
ncbi:DUF4124 domain-containing protein [Kangiella sp. M94]